MCFPVSCVVVFWGFGSLCAFPIEEVTWFTCFVEVGMMVAKGVIVGSLVSLADSHFITLLKICIGKAENTR